MALVPSHPHRLRSCCTSNTLPLFLSPKHPPFTYPFSRSTYSRDIIAIGSNRSGCGRSQHIAVVCKLATVKDFPAAETTRVSKEPHKYFDHVFITVRSGDGGHGAVLNMPKPKDPAGAEKNQSGRRESREKKAVRRSLVKRDSDGSPILPMGGHGGDVVIYADEGLDSLLEFHKKNRFNAKRGGHVDAMGVLTSRLRDGVPATTLRIPVPLGTVVKHKRGKLLADLVHPGDEVLVARGGQGGISLLEMPEHKKSRLAAFANSVMRDESDKVLVIGQPGEEVCLQLILRVVADVGLVGLPNAGKSTLLAVTTRATPDIADYPFTTLMPNLGRLGGDPSLGALQYSSEATLADLPGLIEGAHLGKGLGRNFLRHLRRTSLLVHVVDASTQNPVNDYKTVREELRMYNPGYVERPFVVVLNKIDLPEASNRLPSLIKEISQIGSSSTWSSLEKVSGSKASPSNKYSENPSLGSSDINIEEKEINDYPRPLAVVGTSLLKGIGIDEMLKVIRAALRTCQDVDSPLR